MVFAEDEESVEAFSFDRPDKTLAVGVHVRRTGRYFYGFKTSRPERFEELFAELGVHVMDEIARSNSKFVTDDAQVARLLDHQCSFGCGVIQGFSPLGCPGRSTPRCNIQDARSVSKRFW